MAILPTDSELEILAILWAEGACTVRQVNEILNQKRDVGYTTTLKIMQIMHEKGLVTRSEEARSHLYSPLADEAQTKGGLLRDFVDNAFGGSAMQLVMQALGNHQTTAEELKDIKALISKIENEQQL